MKNKNLSPIILFAYNRPSHLKKTVYALKENKLAKDSVLIVYSDGYKEKTDKDNVLKVRNYLDSLKTGFKKIKIAKRDTNYGLARSVIAGVSEVIDEYGRAIVLEDDIVTSPAFLAFMNTILNEYEKKEKIFSITGYNYPKRLMKIPADYPYDIYFSPRAGSWGWATWKDRWEKADWEVSDYEDFRENKEMQMKFDIGGQDMGNMLASQMERKIDSWAIRWCYTLFKNDGLCVYPVRSYVNNIGLDGSGRHSGTTNKYKHDELSTKYGFYYPDEVCLDKVVLKKFQNIFKSGKLTKFKQVVKNVVKSLRKIKRKIEKQTKIQTNCINKKYYGNSYGGWWVCPNNLNEESIVYSLGVGEDVSFDKEIIDRFSCEVFAFDPTPKSIKWISKQKLPEKFKFCSFGINKKNGVVEFYPPSNKEYVSHSVKKNDALQEKGIEVKMKTLESTMKSLGHTKIDLLKMDIEGSEYSVIEEMVKKDISVDQVLVEFHHRFSSFNKKDTKETIKLLNKAGYLIFSVSDSGEEYSFVKS